MITKASIRQFQVKVDAIAYKVREALPLNAYRKHEIFQAHPNGSYVINFGRAGFFSNFFEVLGYARWCERNHITPLAYGGRFCNDTYRRNLYWSEQGYNGARNVWEYFFEPLSGKSINCFLYPDNFGRNTREHIFAPDGSGIGLIKVLTPAVITEIENERRAELNLPPISLDNDLEQFAHDKGYAKVWRMLAYQRDYPSRRYRQVVNKIIRQYVKIKPNVQAKVNRFYDLHMAGKSVIGLHVRSTDNVGSEHMSVNLERYCRLVDAYSSTSKIYLATDSAHVLSLLKDRYGERLIFNDCVRSCDGNPVHTNHAKRVTQGNPQLGEQVLTDAVLLSKTSFFVHGLSGVASAALFFNPYLSHRSVWDDAC
ncbi:MAG: hypothetical protein AAGB19_05245 [Cyanobacteria bacterium P01_F01_bin.3]